MTHASRRPLRRYAATVVVGLSLMVAGCSGNQMFPADPDRTLQGLQDGKPLRVGVAHHPPWTRIGAGGQDSPRVSGVEVDALREYADTLGTDVDFTPGGEAALIADLERGSLDLVVGGLLEDSPWQDRSALTRPYLSATGPDGEPQNHVMAAAMGENAFLVSVESYLFSAAPSISRQVGGRPR